MPFSRTRSQETSTVRVLRDHAGATIVDGADTVRYQIRAQNAQEASVVAITKDGEIPVYQGTRNEAHITAMELADDAENKGVTTPEPRERLTASHDPKTPSRKLLAVAFVGVWLFGGTTAMTIDHLTSEDGPNLPMELAERMPVPLQGPTQTAPTSPSAPADPDARESAGNSTSPDSASGTATNKMSETTSNSDTASLTEDLETLADNLARTDGSYVPIDLASANGTTTGRNRLDDLGTRTSSADTTGTDLPDEIDKPVPAGNLSSDEDVATFGLTSDS